MVIVRPNVLITGPCFRASNKQAMESIINDMPPERIRICYASLAPVHLTMLTGCILVRVNNSLHKKISLLLYEAIHYHKQV